MATKKKHSHPVSDRIDAIIADGQLDPATIISIAEQMGVTELLAEVSGDFAFLNDNENALLEQFLAKIEIEATKSVGKPDLKVVGGKDVEADPDAAVEAQAGESTNKPSEALAPNREHIKAHLWAYFGPKAIGTVTTGLIEVAWGMSPNDPPTSARLFDVFDIDAIADFVIAKNEVYGQNVYIGATLRGGDTAPFGRSVKEDFLAATSCWVDLDKGDDVKHAVSRSKEVGLRPSYVVETGSQPERRAQIHFILSEPLTDPDRLELLNKLLIGELRGDKAVWNRDRLIRVGGSVSYPSDKKRARGYVNEVTTFRKISGESYRHSEIARVYAGNIPQGASEHGKSKLGLTTPAGRADSEIKALLAASRIAGQWHQSMLQATASMVGKGYSDEMIRLACAPYCDGGFDDPDLTPLIDGGRKKWGKPDPGEGAAAGGAADDDSDDDWSGWSKSAGADSYDKRFEFKPWKDIAFNLDDDFWLVDELLPLHGLAVVYGPAKNYKTFAVSDVAFAVALGRPWAGRQVLQGPVVYIAAEGAPGLHMRVEGYKIEHGLRDVEVPFYLVQARPNLGKIDGDASALIAAINAQAGDTKPVMIVIDTLARTLGDGEENTTGMQCFINNAEMIAEAFGCLTVPSGSPHRLGMDGADQFPRFAPQEHNPTVLALDSRGFRGARSSRWAPDSGER